MSKIFQTSRGLLKITQSCRGLAMTIPARRRLGEIVQQGLVPEFAPFWQPIRGMANQAVRFKKAPIDYPLLTGSDHWRRKKRTVFRRMDTNGDGFITKEDFETSARRVAEYLKLNDVQAEHILNQRLAIWELVSNATQDTTKVSEEEFVGSSVPIVNQSYYRQDFLPMWVSVEFNTTDIDGDGLISKEEHKAFFYSVNVPVEESKNVFDAMDSNKDGFICIEEFAHASAEFFLTEEPDNPFNEFFGPLVD
ncbi:sarcoplasmic calcium-binding protein [Lingula anatina]|uniref:Sarcoplasmic calcium-binding protein n=1 Tax=Lingula anatina TaxID=7574 RepID=A0A1S3HNX9_LINAN|nr:sarcoplasmic calcium-binding protein [Lingula anatina]|eukprot:XP_013387758.1 sarcoplasmic calcium-binding protein [Lingula anatina]